MIELRHTEPAVAHGDFTMLLADHPTLYAFTRSATSGTELLVLANFSGDPVTPEVPEYAEWAAGELLLGNVANGSGPELAPWEARVHRRTVAAGS